MVCTTLVLLLPALVTRVLGLPRPAWELGPCRGVLAKVRHWRWAADDAGAAAARLLSEILANVQQDRWPPSLGVGSGVEAAPGNAVFGPSSDSAAEPSEHMSSRVNTGEKAADCTMTPPRPGETSRLAWDATAAEDKTRRHACLHVRFEVHARRDTAVTKRKQHLPTSYQVLKITNLLTNNARSQPAPFRTLQGPRLEIPCKHCLPKRAPMRAMPRCPLKLNGQRGSLAMVTPKGPGPIDQA